MGNRLTCCGNRNLRAEQNNELIIEESNSKVLGTIKVSNVDSPNMSSATVGGKKKGTKKQSIIRALESGEDISRYQ